MKAIVFVTALRAAPSFYMRGVQVAGALAAAGVASRALDEPSPAWRAIRNSVVVVVKWAPAADVRSLRRQGNLVVLDVVDLLCTPTSEGGVDSLLAHVDAVIVPNGQAREEIARRGFRGPVAVIHHHWDPRLESTRCDAPALQLAYVGDFGSMQSGLEHAFALARDDGVRILDTSSGRDVTAEFVGRGGRVVPNRHDRGGIVRLRAALQRANAQLSVRQPGSAPFRYKPDVKLATAAALGANFLTTRDASTMEILPADYPYLIESADLGEIRRVIAHARATFGGPVWGRALETMAEVKQRTALGTIATEYRRFLCDTLQGERRDNR